MFLETYYIFYITPILAASLDGEPPKQGTYSSLRQQNNDNSSSRHINHNDNPYSLHTTIHNRRFYDTSTSHTTQSRCHIVAGATAHALTGSYHV